MDLLVFISRRFLGSYSYSDASLEPKKASKLDL